jgi:RHS repeat-associated protein
MDSLQYNYPGTNVMVVITDRKIAHLVGTDVYWLPEVKTVQDFYPFGMIQPERTWESDKYRYGFNAEEYDNEVKGVGNQQDYGMRIYDPRIAKFLSVDTMFKQYPMLSTYQFASLSPIQGIDLDGNELKIVVHYVEQHQDKSLFVKTSSVSIDPNKSFELIGKEGTFAKTEVYLNYRGQQFSKPGAILYEPTQETSGGMKPSASYDYTKQPNPDKRKDDWEYILGGKNILKKMGRYLETVLRDHAAPDNKVPSDLLDLFEKKTRKQ